MQGQDPSLLVKLAADIVKARSNGKSMEDSAIAGFEAYQAAQQAKASAAAQQMQDSQGQGQADGNPAAGNGGGDSGLNPQGLPDGVAPGQAGLPAGGLPTVQNLVAGFRGNASIPINQDTIQRKIPTGTR
jgi:hypothetical protein